MERFKALFSNGAQQTAIYASAIVVGKLIAVVMLPVFTFFLTPEEYAKLDIIQTLANLVSVVIGFGLADTLFRFAGENTQPRQKREIAAGVFGLALLASALSLLITQLLAPTIAYHLPGDVSIVQTRIILASLSLTGCILVPLSWLRMQNKAPFYFFATVSRAFAQALLVLLFLYFGYGVTGVLIAGLLCASSLTIFMSIHQWQQTGIKLSMSILKKQGRYGGVLVIAGMAAFLLSCFDRWILASYFDMVTVAQYALACKIGIMAALLTEPYRMWWNPRRFSVLYGENGPEKCAKQTEYGLLIALFSAIIVSAMGALVVKYLSPEPYHGALIYVPYLAGIAALNASINLLNTSVLSEEKTSMPIWINGSAALLACVGFFILIPAYSVWGAIGTICCAQLFRICLYYKIGQSIIIIPYRMRQIGLLSLTTAFTILVIAQADTPTESLLWGGLGCFLLLIIAIVGGTLPTPKNLFIHLSRI
ncbi:MAG: oligosaccharide flippase family protein [Sneathiella sp.]